MTRSALLGSDTRYALFTGVKYLVYLLLSFDVYFFLEEDLATLAYTFSDDFEASQIIQIFSASIDTAAWVILLLLFELETCVLDDEKIVGWVKWALHGIRGVCYLAIVYAFTGYYAELQTMLHVVQLDLPDLCSFVGADYSLLLDLDEYELLDASNCAGSVGGLYQFQGLNVVAEGAALRSAQWLAWTDVFNSGAWILVCILLEIEVRLQLRGDLSDRIMRVNTYAKFVLYGTLFMAAAYWGSEGSFLDFWDAALWLFAFIFIELNVFEWQFESQPANAPSA